MRFKVGDKVFYPGRGICEIRHIATRQIDGNDMELYHLMFLLDEATVFVPVIKARAIGIRPLLNKSEVPKLYEFLMQEIQAPSLDYRIRYQNNVNRLSSGTILDIADVVKSLVYLSSHKKLSDRENEMLERARSLLINEIAQVTGTDRSKVETEVDQMLERVQVNS
jgi:CarD family transcriptional regulator